MPSSICSTASQMSQMSVCFEGQEMSLEAAIDRGICDLQNCLNGLQCQLRTLAGMDDLSESPAEDFRLMIEYTDKADNCIDDMEALFSELKDVTRQILGPCPKECKEWYREHKAQRKAAAEAEKVRRKAAKVGNAAFNDGVAAVNGAYEAKGR